MVRVGLVVAAPVVVAPARTPLEEEIDALCMALAERHAGRAPAEIAGLAAARELYRAFSTVA